MRLADILGTKGSLHFDMLNSESYQFYKYDDGTRNLVEAIAYDEGNNLRIVIRDFYECCLRDKPDNFERTVLTAQSQILWDKRSGLIWSGEVVA